MAEAGYGGSDNSKRLRTMKLSSLLAARAKAHFKRYASMEQMEKILSDMEPEERYTKLLKLQKVLNQELQDLFETSKSQGREFLSKVLIEKIESIIERLNLENYGFGRFEYSGDVNYENSEQWFSNGAEMGTGIILHFHGYSVQITWEAP